MAKGLLKLLLFAAAIYSFYAWQMSVRALGSRLIGGCRAKRLRTGMSDEAAQRSEPAPWMAPTKPCNCATSTGSRMIARC